jgi:mono/diheme cytochrome c family protein
MALASFAAAPAFAVEADTESTEARQLTYVVAGDHAQRGAFSGTITVTFKGQRGLVTQTMTFADGSTQTVQVQGTIRDGELRGQVAGSSRGATDVLAMARGGARAAPSLRVRFDDQQVSTRLVGGPKQSKLLASAEGGLKPAPIDQGISAEDAATFAHRGQGLSIAPASWFEALEQAASDAPFKAPENMRAFGFLPDADDPNGLPVGLAVQGSTVGLTCAACHTTELTVNGTPIRIQGGRASVDLGMFRKAFGQALGATALTPAKFQRFAARVLTAEGKPVTPETMQAVGAGLKGFLEKAKQSAQISAQLQNTDSGPGRVDAFGNGANQIFGRLNPKNLAPARAPVRLPYLWGTADFAWVQYNGGIKSPLARNLTASIAAGATLKVLAADGTLLPEAERWESSARVEDLEALEAAMEQIQPPAFPGYVDAEAAERGAKLYAENCSSCHDRARWTGPYTQRKRDLQLFALDVIGTDPNNVLAFSRTVDASALGLGTAIPVTEGLDFVSGSVLAKQGRAQDGPQFRAPQAYRARPLDGIWAAAPYLHNGSVLTMDELLGPPAERRDAFRLSTSPELDTARLGLVEPAEGWVYDTSKPGNSNAGHEFRDAPAGTSGVIGRALSKAERSDLIEFLKTR